jgi:hypothetical protein
MPQAITGKMPVPRYYATGCISRNREKVFVAKVLGLVLDPAGIEYE